MPDFSPKKNHIFSIPHTIQKDESIDMTPCVISFLVNFLSECIFHSVICFVLQFSAVY